MGDDKNDTDQTPSQLHGYLIQELRNSDKAQWKKIDEHHSWLTETRIRIRLLKSGVVALAMIAAAVGVWLRWGWEAVVQLLWR